MIFHLFLVCFGIQAARSFPQTYHLPELENFAPPEEVNNLPQHNQYPRSIKSYNDANNIEQTIKEVEEIIKNDSTLPRLTRGEILDILENITMTDAEQLPVQSAERDPKAIMVVMPYTPGNNPEKSMEELFTKPPVTHIVSSEQSNKTENTTNAGYKRKQTRAEYKKRTGEDKKQPIKESPIQIKPPTYLEEAITTSPPRVVTTVSTTTSVKLQKRRRRPTSTTTTTSSTTAAPADLTPIVTTFRPRRPLRRKSTTTSTPKYPNHKYPEDVTITKENIALLPAEALNVISAPKLAPTQINYSLEDLEGQENEKYNVIVAPDYLSDKWNKKPSQFSTATPSIEIEVPEHFKKVVNDLNILGINVSEPNLQVSSKSEAQKFKELLASIEAYAPPTPKPITTTGVPDAANVADNLSPDMKELLMSFGLLPNPNEKQKAPNKLVSEFNPVKAEVNPNSYQGFKPLPDDSAARSEMEELLAQYGLGTFGRKQKSMTKKSRKEEKVKEISNISLDVVPDEFKSVLTDIGLSDTKKSRKIREHDLDQQESKQHVFNPVEAQYASEEELKKLEKLLGFVKQLDKLNGSFTEEDLKHVDVKGLKELVSSITQNNTEVLVPLDHQKAPNPNEFDFGLIKNEIKRQETTTTQSEEVVTVKAATQSSVLAEENESPPIKLLEDSFGGQTSSEAPPETTTQTRRTGFYYLVDWNTFLDIDNQEGKRVNLRFQPTIGDPKRFLSVSVP